jgi:hypothetical protein
MNVNMTERIKKRPSVNKRSLFYTVKLRAYMPRLSSIADLMLFNESSLGTK